jgi:phospholipid/cholesterol/gamma-HCH transport system substrate-binding protein
LKISNEVKIGAFTIISSTILILGYSFLKGNDIFSRETKLYAIYDRVDGLAVSKPVLINGFPIGRVSEMKLLPSGKTLVEFKIAPDYEVPKNTTARLESTDLLGSKAIVFSLGNSKDNAKDQDTLSSNVEKSLAESVQPVQKKAEQIITKMDSLLTSINSVVDARFQKNINRSFQSIANTLETLEGTSKKVDGLVGNQTSRIDAILGNAESITANLKNNNEHLNNILANFDKVSDDVAKSNILETLQKANGAISDLQATINKINNGEGSVGLLLNDEALYQNLNNAAKNLDNLMIDIKARPKRYVSFSVFGGKKE